MLLSELVSRSGVTPDRMHGDAEISGMVMDSRKAKPGSLFTAMPSKNSDAHSFIPAAKALGATAVLTYSEEGIEAAVAAGLAAILVTDFYEGVWRLAKIAFGNPSASMKIIGVTGTNGKTTTAWLIRDMLVALGVKAGYLGTLGFQIPGEERELSNTTPFCIELNELLAEARDKGVEAMAIEVSSHALAERRVDGIEFDAAVFTNLTQDHLDFHGSMEAYEAAKLRLFTVLPNQSEKLFRGLLNVGDEAGARFASLLASQRWESLANFLIDGYVDEEDREFCSGTDSWSAPSYLTYSTNCDAGATVVPEKPRVYVDRLKFELDIFLGRDLDLDPLTAPGFDASRGDNGSRMVFEANLGGQYNLENVISAVATTMSLNYNWGQARDSLARARPVPGRFEPVKNDAGIGILVDYAHTPDALEKLLDAVRPLTQGRIITVFGCGGDRDRSKRPKMAKAASERSDVTVVTSDNPRTEDPQAILDEVLTGIVPGRDSIDIIDRREAIAHAIKIAQPGDVVVIAGKGHENYQIIGRTKYPMDDREMARAALAVRT